MTDAQRALLFRIDPEITKNRGDTLDADWTDAETELSLSNFRPAHRDRAVALLVAHRTFIATDPDARSLAGPSTNLGGRVSAASQHLPPGYPADWYDTNHGRALIGLCRSSSSIGLLTGH